MEVANKLKELSLDINTVWFYDEAEETEKMMRSLKAEGEKEGIKKGIKQGAKEREKSIAKNLLKNDISIEVISESTGLSIEKLEELKKEA